MQKTTTGHSAHAELKMLQRQMEVVSRICPLMTSATSMSHLLEQLMDLTVEMMEVEAASLCMLDEPNNEIVFRVTKGQKADIIRHTRLPRGAGIVGWVIEHDQPLLVINASEDPRFLDEIDRFTGYQTRDVLCAPLKLHNQVFGCIELINKRDGRDFRSLEVELLASMALPIAMAIENGRLLDQTRHRVDQLQTLLEVGRRMDSTLPVDDLLQFILDSATRVSRAEASSVLLLDPEKWELYFRVATGTKADKIKELHLSVDQGIAGAALREDRALLIRDVSQDPHFHREISERLNFPTRSILALPLKAQDVTVGVLELVNLPQDLGDEAEYIEYVSGFATQAAIAIERSRLYELLQGKVDLANKELRDANRLLEAEKAKVEAIIQSMADGVMVTDDHQGVVLINPAALSMLGLTEGEALHKSIEDVVGETPLMYWMTELADGRSGTASSEFEMNRNGTTVSLVAHVAPVTDETGSILGVVAVMNDVTKLKEISAMKSELVSIVSHELRSPLTSIKAGAATLLRNVSLEECTKTEVLEIIESQCDRLTRMVGSLLNVARIDSGRSLDMHYSKGDLQELLQRIVDIQGIYARNHKITVEVPEKLRHIETDIDKLEQVFTNLIDNAIKYSPDGGSISVTVSTEPDNASFLRVNVSDEGLGIPAEEFPKLFQMYERTRGEGARRARGTGLGLYLVRRLVEALGGEINVRSEVGQGTTFSFTFPRQPSQ